MVYHEVLLALLGHTGGLIVSKPTRELAEGRGSSEWDASAEHGLRVNEDLAHLMLPYERAMVERAAQIGHVFAQIEAFTCRVRIGPSQGAKKQDGDMGECRSEQPALRCAIVSENRIAFPSHTLCTSIVGMV